MRGGRIRTVRYSSRRPAYEIGLELASLSGPKRTITSVPIIPAAGTLSKPAIRLGTSTSSMHPVLTDFIAAILAVSGGDGDALRVSMCLLASHPNVPAISHAGDDAIQKRQ